LWLRVAALGNAYQHQDEQRIDHDARGHGDEESKDIVHRAKDSDDGAAVHDIIGHAKHAGEGTGDGTAHDICWNDLQWTRGGKRNSAFGNTKKAHEQRGDTGVFFRLGHQARRRSVATPTASGGTAIAVAAIPMGRGLPAAMSPPPKRNAVLLKGPPISAAIIAPMIPPRTRVEAPCMPDRATVRASKSDATGAPIR